ncbi:hypothetical protein [uncultured Arthrobacter sp.]|mgnify:CR=1 FL=1
MSNHLLILAAVATVAASSAISYSIGYTTALLARREEPTPTPERTANNG